MSLRNLILAVFAAVMLSTQLGNGCVSDSSGVPDNSPPLDHGGEVDLPVDSRVVEEGGGRLTYEAPHAGRAYVYDIRTDRVIFHARLRAGDDLVIIPNSNRININGKKVFDDPSLDPKHGHRIYWLLDKHDDSGDRLPPALSSARRVAFGTGDLQYRASKNGRVWLWDQTDRKVVYQSDIQRHQTLAVSPSKNSIQIEGSKIAGAHQGLHPRHEYAIYFKD